MSGDWPGRGEPRKADRGPLEARQALRGEAGGRLPVPGWASGGAGVRPPPQSAALPLSPGQSHQEGQRLAGAGITTGQGRKTGPKEREEPVKAEEEKREKLSDSELELKNDEEGPCAAGRPGLPSRCWEKLRSRAQLLSERGD